MGFSTERSLSMTSAGTMFSPEVSQERDIQSGTAEEVKIVGGSVDEKEGNHTPSISNMTKEIVDEQINKSAEKATPTQSSTSNLPTRISTNESGESVDVERIDTIEEEEKID